MQRRTFIKRVGVEGRITIPADIRKDTGIAEGTLMEIHETEEGIAMKICPDECGLANMAEMLEETLGVIRNMEPEKEERIRTHIRAIAKILEGGVK